MASKQGQRNQRAVRACARCRKRKIKCDAMYPQCGSCALVGAECMGFDPKANREHPRSIVTHLQDKIKSLETQLSELKTARRQPASQVNPRIHQIQDQLAAVCHPGTSQRGRVHDRLALLSYMRPCLVPSLSGAKCHTLGPGRKISLEPIMRSRVAGIPRNVVNIMLRNYFEVYMAQYPIIDQQLIVEACDRIYAGEDSTFDQFVVCMALSISAHTLVRYDEARAIQAAEEFCDAALQLNQIFNDDPLIRLQALLLLSHCSFLSPSRMNAIACTRASMRLCVELGLHRVTHRHSQWRLFWTSFALDAQAHSVMGLAYTLPLPDFSTDIYPAMMEYVAANEEDEGIIIANHLYQWRLFEVDVTMNILHPRQEQIQPEDQSDPWQTRTIKRLHAWRRETNALGGSEKIEFRELMYQCTLLRVTRLSPRLPLPALAMRRQCMRAALSVLGEYERLFYARRVFYLVHCVWHLFEAAVVLVEIAHANFDQCADLEPIFQPSEAQGISQALKITAHLLRKLFDRWKQVQYVSLELEPLIQGAVMRLDCFLDHRDIPVADPRQLSLIHRYLRGCKSELPESPLASVPMQPVLSTNMSMTISEVLRILQPDGLSPSGGSVAPVFSNIPSHIGSVTEVSPTPDWFTVEDSMPMGGKELLEIADPSIWTGLEENLDGIFAAFCQCDSSV